MASQAEYRIDHHQLHRKVLNTYWTVLLISIAAECIALLIKLKIEPESIREFLIDSVMVPTIIQLVVIGLNEAAYYYKREKPWFIIISGTLIASSLLIANKTIHLQYIFLLSMLVSLFYFNVKQLVYAFVVNMAAFAVVYGLYWQIRESMSLYEVSAFVFMMIGLLFILRSVILRGQDILMDHTRMVKSEQEMIARHAMMDRMVKVDALTNLYNHKTFYEYLELLIEQSNTYAMSLQLAVVDIDNFKSINDTYGHSVGDIVLTRVANALTDALSSNEIVARYGGEEFAVIFPGTSLHEAYDKLEVVRQLIAALEHSEMDDRKITVSIGLSEHLQGESSSELFSKSDALLYAAKRSGKNRTVM